MDTIETLQQQLSQAAGTAKVDLLNQLAAELHASHPDQAESYANEALQMAQALNYPKGVACAHRELATAFWRIGVYRQAVNHAQKAIQQFETLGEAMETAVTWRILGNIYGTHNHYDEALHAFLTSLRIAQAYNDLPSIARCYNNIGILYSDLNDFPRAFSYQLQAAELLEKLGNYRSLARTYNNLGTNYARQKQFDEALLYYQKAVDTAAKGPLDYYNLGNIYENMGEVYAGKNDLETALTHYHTSLDLQEKTNDKRGMVSTYLLMGQLYGKLADYPKAMECLDKSVQLAKEADLPKKESEVYQALSELYEQQGDFKQALHYHKQYSSLWEQVFDESKSRQFAELQARYDLERRDQEAEIYRLKTQALEQMVVERTKALEISAQREQALAHELQKALTREVELGRLKSQVIEVVSHEFRTPLTTINGSANLLKAHFEQLAPELREERLNRIQEAVHQITTLLDEALVVNRMDTLMAFARTDKFDLRLVCEELLASLKAEYGAEANFQLSYEETADYILHLNMAFVREVLTQLLTNAIKYSPYGGQVDVRLATTPHQEITITVQDVGIGIPAVELEKLFTSFFRASNATDTRGIGLGLSVVKTLVEAMNGRITAHSDGENKGSSFTVYLPQPVSSPLVKA